jgi:hypothetical protein
MSDKSAFAAAIDAAITDTAYAEAIAGADIIATALVTERELVANGILETQSAKTFVLIYESLKGILDRVYAQVKFLPDATPSFKASSRAGILAQAADAIAANLKARAEEQNANDRLAKQQFRAL